MKQLYQVYAKQDPDSPTSGYVPVGKVESQTEFGYWAPIGWGGRSVYIPGAQDKAMDLLFTKGYSARPRHFMITPLGDAAFPRNNYGC